MRFGQRVNICFHGIGTPNRELEPGEAAYWVSEAFFEEVLSVVGTDPRVAISFDDGNASDVEIALPALRQRKLRGAFFPVADRIGNPGSVDAAGLRSLADQGMTVGSHGMRHRSWRGLSAEDAAEEFSTARRVIEDCVGAPVTAAACPLGLYDRQVLKHLRTSGYRQVFTSDRARARANGWLQPRYSVCGGDTINGVQALIAERPSITGSALSTARITAKRLR